MILSFLLDTNIVSDPIKKKPNPRVLSFLEKEDGKYCICAPVLHELEFGVAILPDSKRKKILSEYIENIKEHLVILPYNLESSLFHAKLRAKLIQEGKSAPFVDTLIASIARTSNLVLVTLNEKDFSYLDTKFVYNPANDN